MWNIDYVAPDTPLPDNTYMPGRLKESNPYSGGLAAKTVPNNPSISSELKQILPAFFAGAGYEITKGVDTLAESAQFGIKNATE